MESVRYNDETIVPAGHQLGKDFISAMTAIWWMSSRRPARVVTTSVKYDQLNDVLWGEIRRLMSEARIELPLNYSHLRIRQTDRNGDFVPLCELVGQQVGSKHEGLFGRHLQRDMPRTLVIFDEASGIDQRIYEGTDTWAHHKLIIGNPYPCTNFFYQGVTAGDLMAPDGSRFYRKVIRIKAEDSPSVRLALKQIEQGQEPTNEVLVPGCLDYELYLKRRQIWDPIRQCIGLDAKFYEGAASRLFPPIWLNQAHRNAQTRSAGNHRTMGVDTAEGGDDTCWTVVDEGKLLYQEAQQTPDTSIIPNRTAALMIQWGVSPEDVYFDRGGGGKEHADIMRSRGYNVQTVGFGEPATDPSLMRRLRSLGERQEDMEERYVYKNRRAEMYGIARRLLNVDLEGNFGIDDKYHELKRQLSLMPLLFDHEGRMYLPPKERRSVNSQEQSLRDILGCSPDEADSFVLATFGQVKESRTSKAGAIL